MRRAPDPRRARWWHVLRLARILWAAIPRRSLRARLGDIALLARLIRKGQIVQVPGRWGPLGFLARDGARVHALYTHPDARRQGIASRLMQDAMAKAGHLELWTAQANDAARAFYARQGFYPAAQSNGQGNDDGLPDVLLKWERDAP